VCVLHVCCARVFIHIYVCVCVCVACMLCEVCVCVCYWWIYPGSGPPFIKLNTCAGLTKRANCFIIPSPKQPPLLGWTKQMKGRWPWGTSMIYNNKRIKIQNRIRKIDRKHFFNFSSEDIEIFILYEIVNH
jgi:hypothetical protein